MVKQKFIPAGYLLCGLLNQFIPDDDPYIQEQFDRDSEEVTAMIFSHEDKLFSLLEYLQQFNSKEMVQRMSGLSIESRFLLLAAFWVTLYHGNASDQMIPYFPSKTTYQRLFEYVRFRYEEYKDYCVSNHLCMWYELIGLSMDHGGQFC